MPYLLEEENRLVWAVDQALVGDADSGFPVDGDWAEAVYAAETRKEEACRPLYSRIQQRVDRVYRSGGFSFAERFWSDFSLLGTLLVPVASVERCATAQRAFRRAFAPPP